MAVTTYEMRRGARLEHLVVAQDDRTPAWGEARAYSDGELVSVFATEDDGVELSTYVRAWIERRGGRSAILRRTDCRPGRVEVIARARDGAAWRGM